MKKTEVNEIAKFKNLTLSEFESVGESFRLLDEGSRFEYLAVGTAESKLSEDYVLQAINGEPSPRIRYLGYKWILEKAISVGRQYTLEGEQVTIEVETKVLQQVETDPSKSIQSLLTAFLFVIQERKELNLKNFSLLSDETKLEVFEFVNKLSFEKKELLHDVIVSFLTIFPKDSNLQKGTLIGGIVQFVSDAVKNVGEGYWDFYDGFTRYESGMKLDKFWMVVPHIQNDLLMIEIAKILPIPYLYEIPGIKDFGDLLLSTVLHRPEYRNDRVRDSFIFSDKSIWTKVEAASGRVIDEEVLSQIAAIDDDNYRNDLLLSISSRTENISSVIPAFILCGMLTDNRVCGERGWEWRNSCRLRLLSKLKELLSEMPFRDQQLYDYELRIIQFCTTAASYRSSTDLEAWSDNTSLKHFIEPGSFWYTLQNIRNSNQRISLPVEHYGHEILEELGFYRFLEDEKYRQANSESLDQIKERVHKLEIELDKVKKTSKNSEAKVILLNEEVSKLNTQLDEIGRRLVILMSSSNRLREIESAILLLSKQFTWLWVLLIGCVIYFVYDYVR